MPLLLSSDSVFNGVGELGEDNDFSFDALCYQLAKLTSFASRTDPTYQSFSQHLRQGSCVIISSSFRNPQIDPTAPFEATF